MRCRYCSEEILEPASAYRRIVGWEKKAVGGTRRGGSDIVLRERVDEYACRPCIVLIQVGLSPEQETLL